MAAELIGWDQAHGCILAEGLSMCVQDCELCHLGDDQYCPKAVMTYNSKDWGDNDASTYGGYSNRYVLHHE